MSRPASSSIAPAQDSDPSISLASVSSAPSDAATPTPSAAAARSWSCDDPLPVGPFRSQEEAVRTVKQYAVRQGFAVSIFRTRPRGIKRVYLCCSQGKNYRGPRGRQMALRDRGTKKVGCSYGLAINFNRSAPEEKAWSASYLNNCHTGHLRCTSKIMLSALPAARRVSREGGNVEAKVVEMHQSGVAPRVILQHFKETSVIILASDVHNIIQKANSKARSGKPRPSE